MCMKRKITTSFRGLTEIGRKKLNFDGNVFRALQNNPIVELYVIKTNLFIPLFPRNLSTCTKYITQGDKNS